MPGAAPFFTIITATRNAAAALPRLLESLAGQTYRNFELIIQDGVSTDGTVAVVETWRGQLPALSMISEPDTGIYDAWNKALPRIRGQWVLFLGADDFLLNTSALAFAAKDLAVFPGHTLYAASPVALVDAAGCALDTVAPSRVLERNFSNGIPVPHQGLFHRSRLFILERFDPALCIAGDYDFFCRTVAPDNIVYLDRMCVCMGLGGLSRSLQGMLRTSLDVLRVSRRYFPTTSRLPLFWYIACVFICKGIASLSSETVGRAVADCYRKLKGKPALWSKRENASLNAFSLIHASDTPLKSATGAFGLEDKIMFSLLVATCDRTEPLHRLLVSLTEQSCHDFEVLIADQNPPGFLDGLVAEFQDTLLLRVIPVPNKDVSSARNALLPYAKGALVAFPDDDCWYRPDTLEQARAFFAVNPHAHGLLGQCYDPADARTNPRPSGRAIFRVSFSVFQIGTLAHFYRKAVADVVGGFDPELGPGTGLPYGGAEDNDYLLRVLTAGFTVVHAPSVQIYHPDISRNPPSMEKVRAYSRGRIHVLRKNKLPLWFKLANLAYLLLRQLPYACLLWAWHCLAPSFQARLRGMGFWKGKAVPAFRVALRDGGWRLAFGKTIRYLRQVENRVRRIMLAAPARSCRLPARRKRPLHVVVDHDLGGGANAFRERYAAKLLARETDVLVWQYLNGTGYYFFEWRSARTRKTFRASDLESAAVFVEAAAPDVVFFNNMANWPRLPETLEALNRLKTLGAEVHVFLHDYFVLCPAYSLLDKNGMFCGVPMPPVPCGQCLFEHPLAAPHDGMDIAAWRRMWARFLPQADSVSMADDSDRYLIARVYPQVAERMLITPLEPLQCWSPLPSSPPHTSIVVGVIGHIARHKGARIVEELILLMSARGLDARVVVIGTLESSLRHPRLHVTGPYKHALLPSLLQKHGVTLGLVPSPLPETFCYVAQETEMLGLPLICLDLGAQGARAHRYSKGFPAPTPDAAGCFDAILQAVSSLSKKPER